MNYVEINLKQFLVAEIMVRHYIEKNYKNEIPEEDMLKIKIRIYEQNKGKIKTEISFAENGLEWPR